MRTAPCQMVVWPYHQMQMAGPGCARARPGKFQAEHPFLGDAKTAIKKARRSGLLPGREQLGLRQLKHDMEHGGGVHGTTLASRRSEAYLFGGASGGLVQAMPQATHHAQDAAPSVGGKEHL